MRATDRSPFGLITVGSRYAQTIPIRTKAEAKSAIKELLQQITRTSPHNSALLLSENAREFLSREMTDFEINGKLTV